MVVRFDHRSLFVPYLALDFWMVDGRGSRESVWPLPLRRGTHVMTVRQYIYYYTPLPLKLANKQQATSNNKQQQAHLRAVLAIARSKGLGPDSTLAILEPTWCPCQIQVLSQKLKVAAQGGGAKSGGALPNLRSFGPKAATFHPKQP